MNIYICIYIYIYIYIHIYIYIYIYISIYKCGPQAPQSAAVLVLLSAAAVGHTAAPHIAAAAASLRVCACVHVFACVYVRVKRW